LPVTGTETEIDQKFPDPKYNAADLAKKLVKEKEGPAVILFEVELLGIIIEFKGSLYYWKRCSCHK